MENVFMKSKNEIIEEQQETIEVLHSQIKNLDLIKSEQDELIKNLERRLDVFIKIANDLRKERDDLSKQLEASKPFVCCCQRCRRRTDNDEK
jgi:predicted RNase H-like nuclease (RuvC/YqgF family)